MASISNESFEERTSGKQFSGPDTEEKSFARLRGGRTADSLRIQSMSLNAVINHRRALIGALISGIGSNMSLPSCVPQDQDFLQGHSSANAGLPISLRLSQNRGEKPDEDRCKNFDRKIHPNLLQLTPVNTAAGSLTTFEPKKRRVPTTELKGFYLYLYLASVIFVITMYITVLRNKARRKTEKQECFIFDAKGYKINQAQQYGSFCLRLGAVGFGAGSLVFTGLQIGAEIASGPYRAITPGARLLLVTAQMHFIFLNSKNLELTRHSALAKLGLMHMIATNLCEWLQALVEETQHEIDQLGHAYEGDQGILKSLLRNASPFLFPCTIEFSLICAVILFEMWKRVDERPVSKSESPARSLHQLSIDCSSAHRGLFGGILIIAATILSLIMFFVLKEAKPKMAIQQVTALEAAILILSTIVAIAGALKLQNLQHKAVKPPHLDATLLTAAQAGVYLHCLFGVVGGILTMGPTWALSLVADMTALIQSTCQTLLVKIAWRRRCTRKEKPGKELITFLIVVNIALWTVNTLEKSRAMVRPDHLRFFGVWAWTIITHVSMPLVIFYRFHSAICLFEVWKSCYKYRPAEIDGALAS
ncbi:proton channel OtopLc-like isoform X4 [Prorops nasuta]|uniref:proton channel OtopLc-like isoform X4 n=1 Tax=Prorops nasuta TaxID=863751 RepID=UPI0034CDED9E